MVIIDTNIICRYLLKDNPSQYQRVKSILLHEEVYLDSVTMAESFWVLTTYYKLPKREVLEKLRSFTNLPNLLQPQKSVITMAINLCLEYPLSYIDCWLIALSATTYNKLVTFNRKLDQISQKYAKVTAN